MEYAKINTNYVSQRLDQAQANGVQINLIEIILIDSKMLLM